MSYVIITDKTRKAPRIVVEHQKINEDYKNKQILRNEGGGGKDEK